MYNDLLYVHQIKREHFSGYIWYSWPGEMLRFRYKSLFSPIRYKPMNNNITHSLTSSPHLYFIRRCLTKKKNMAISYCYVLLTGGFYLYRLCHTKLLFNWHYRFKWELLPNPGTRFNNTQIICPIIWNGRFVTFVGVRLGGNWKMSK